MYTMMKSVPGGNMPGVSVILILNIAYVYVCILVDVCTLVTDIYRGSRIFRWVEDQRVDPWDPWDPAPWVQ